MDWQNPFRHHYTAAMLILSLYSVDQTHVFELFVLWIMVLPESIQIIPAFNSWAVVRALFLNFPFVYVHLLVSPFKDVLYTTITIVSRHPTGNDNTSRFLVCLVDFR